MWQFACCPGHAPCIIRKDFELDERVEIGRDYIALRARYGLTEEAA